MKTNSTGALKSTDQIIVIDLTSKVVKSVWVSRTKSGFTLRDYAIVEGVPGESLLGKDSVAHQLSVLPESFAAAGKKVVFIFGMRDAILRNVDLPEASDEDLRRMLKLNGKSLLKQQVSDYTFDCLPSPIDFGHSGEGSVKPTKHQPYLVGGAKHAAVRDVSAAAKEAGLVATAITLGPFGTTSAASTAMAKGLGNDAVVVVDLGLADFSISFLVAGIPVLTRVISIGVESFSGRVLEAFQVPPQVAEELKTGIIQTKLHALFSPMAHEFRAAIDYFERAYNQRVRNGFVLGDLARSPLIIETLQDLEIPCRKLDFSATLNLDLPDTKRATITEDLPLLASSIGTALTWLHPEAPKFNLLAEDIAAAAARRRDPVRLGTLAASLGVVLLLLFAGYVKWKNSKLAASLRSYEATYKLLEAPSREAIQDATATAELERKLGLLQAHATNRFLWALPLSAFQCTAVDDIELVNLKIGQTVTALEVPAPGTSPGKKQTNCVEQITITLLAKNCGETTGEENFVEAIASNSYFETSLRAVDPVLLKTRFARQVDPLDVDKTFTLFTLECYYPERTLGYE